MIRTFGLSSTLATICLLFACLSAPAYDRDTHYYVMFLVALDSGFSVTDAAEIASCAQYVDEDGDTWPGKILGIEQRREYHFVSGISDTFLTIHDGCYARHNINRAFRANDRYMMSVAMHPYADSWSHETYGSVLGHLFQGHEPDRPYKRVGTFMEMCRQMYTVLQWYRHVNGLPDVARRATDKDLSDTASLGKECSLFSSYEDEEIKPRCANWTTTIARVFGVSAAYTPPQGALLAAFSNIVTIYSMPRRSNDCYGAHWDSPSAKALDGEGSPGTAPTKRAAAPPNYIKILARLAGKPADFVARYLVAHPDIVVDPRIQALITNVPVLDALLKQAKSGKRMQAVMHVLVACDWTGVDYVPVVATNFLSTSFYIRLLTANLLMQSGMVPAGLGPTITAFFDTLDPAKMNKAKMRCLLDALLLDESRIAGCASNTVNLLGALLKDHRVGHVAAARLYAVGCEEVAVTNPVAGEEELRHAAVGYLRQAIASNDAASAIRYWQVRSYEDFDDATNGMPHDASNMVVLAGVIAEAVTARNVDLIHAAASAFATYGVEDHPDSYITNTLVQALAAAPAEAQWQIGYALEKLTGVTFDLTSTGLAKFDWQWRAAFDPARTRVHDEVPGIE